MGIVSYGLAHNKGGYKNQWLVAIPMRDKYEAKTHKQASNFQSFRPANQLSPNTRYWFAKYRQIPDIWFAGLKEWKLFL